jgi:polysaccharide biosynthesis transport protein
MMDGDTIERGGGAPTWVVNHLPLILWQRRYYVLGCFLALLLAGTVAAFALPRTYRSTATLLVQSQDLPTTIVESPTTSAVEQRIARIRQQVLSREDLIQLIEQNDLYPSERNSLPLSKIIEKMRKSTGVGALSSDIGQQSMNSSTSTIAIAMSFDYPDPAKAQAVLQSFVSKFLSMDSQDVEDQAGLTVRFLQDQASKLQGQISSIEGELTALKSRNGAALANSGAPPLIDTGSFSAQITSLQNENRQLIAQAKKPSSKNDALAAAEAALAAAQAQYSDTHPDVLIAKERVAQLRRIQQTSDDASTLQEQISANNSAIHQLMEQRDESLSRANAAMAGQARAPAILEQAMQLESRATSLRTQYQDVAANLLKAQNSARMAKEQRAERLTLVEPASLPDNPYSPNRLLLIGGGAAAGLGLGLLLALSLELMAKPVRSPRQIENLGLPVIGVVPLIGQKSSALRLPGFLSREKRLAA